MGWCSTAYTECMHIYEINNVEVVSLKSNEAVNYQSTGTSHVSYLYHVHVVRRLLPSGNTGKIDMPYGFSREERWAEKSTTKTNGYIDRYSKVF